MAERMVTDEEIMEAVRQHGTYKAAGQALGCSAGRVSERLYRHLTKEYTRLHPKPFTITEIRNQLQMLSEDQRERWYDYLDAREYWIIAQTQCLRSGEDLRLQRECCAVCGGTGWVSVGE